MIKLKLDVTSQYCNRWPTLIIWHNEQEIYCKQIENKQQISLKLDAKENQTNTLAIGMKGKQFGKDGIYDTVVTDGRIIEDLQIKINAVSLDDIPILDLLLKNDYHINIVEGMDDNHADSIKANGELCFNGHYNTQYELPLYNYLTNAKWKQPLKTMSRHSNSSALFHYEEQQKEIKEIEEILDEIDGKFSNIRSKIRNT
jgi:hypothetical protein